jgi:hypothetical protein
MISRSRFHLPKLTIFFTQMHALVHGALQLQTGQEYPLSGFPKQLVLEKGSKRGNSAMLHLMSLENPDRLLIVVGVSTGFDDVDLLCSQLSAWEAPSLQDMPIVTLHDGFLQSVS